MNHTSLCSQRFYIAGFDKVFPVSTIPHHNDLQMIQGGNGVDEYYHVDSASYAAVQQGALTNNFAGIVTPIQLINNNKIKQLLNIY